MIEKIAKGSTLFLLAWYFCSLYIVTQDTTMSLGMMVSFEIINVIMIIMLLRVLLFNYKTPSFTDFSVSFFSIYWFCYSTYRDYTQDGYYYFLKVFYVGIDLLSMLFLIDTFINFLINMRLFNIGKESIKKINNIMKIGFSTTFPIAYFILCRGMRWI